MTKNCNEATQRLRDEEAAMNRKIFRLACTALATAVLVAAGGVWHLRGKAIGEAEFVAKAEACNTAIRDFSEISSRLRGEVSHACQAEMHDCVDGRGCDGAECAGEEFIDALVEVNMACWVALHEDDGLADFEPSAEAVWEAINKTNDLINRQIAVASDECRVVVEGCSLEEGDCPVAMEKPGCVDDKLLRVAAYLNGTYTSLDNF